MAKCPICKQWLTGFNWAKTKNGKNWLKNNSSGEWHDCPKNQGTFSKNIDLTYNPTFPPSFIFCGKCTTLCKNDWCPKCEMCPQTTYNGNTTVDNLWFSPVLTVDELQDSNRSQIMENHESDKRPCNWMWMKEDGTMISGHKSTSQLIKWYEKEGKGILKELYSKIEYKKRIVT